MDRDRLEKLYDEWEEMAEPAWDTLIALGKLFKEKHGLTDKEWDEICDYSDETVKDPITIP